MCREREQVCLRYWNAINISNLFNRILGLAWEDMVVGNPVDEQRTLRLGFSKEDAAMEAQTDTIGVRRLDDDDEDVDPNDIIPPIGAQAAAKKPSGPVDSDDDEDWFYG